MTRFFWRHQPPPCRKSSVKAGVGVLLGLAAIAWLGDQSGVAMLIAPFGATAVLVFGMPESHLSQPANVVGGHMLSATISLAMNAVLPDTTWAMVATVAVVVAMMAFLRVTHPPAGADPLVVMNANPGLDFLLTPVLLGSVALVAMAMLVHRLPPRTVRYPLPIAAPAN